jgi:Fe2+ or Zn2+ uptake regulation protein
VKASLSVTYSWKATLVFEWTRGQHHHELVDVDTGRIIEFADQEIELLLNQIAQQLGYKLVAHRYELYATRVLAWLHRDSANK